ncbi:aryl-alcohol dehydrogenase-like predicted oxidoreductase [Pedobacter sp. UYP30]|uniref:aldo/keto reductase n=1 Tax=Pedobacter sp. UYP30 TaxID=1756400 RepID=UPI0033944352
MKKEILGKTGLEIAPVVIGGNVFGWTIDEEESFKMLDAFRENGFNFIDTADVYSRWKEGNSGGESETIIGNWQSRGKRRQDIIIATKVGMDAGEGANLKRDHIIKQAENSLKRLKTDYIDLYFSHQDDESLTVEEPLRAHEELIKAGKVRFIGASNFSATRLEEAIISSVQNHLPQYTVYQPGYNLIDKEYFEEDHERICLEHGLAVVSYYSLAAGFLTGKYRSKDDLTKSVRGKKAEKYLNERGFNILKALDNVADKHQCTQAAVALGWLIFHPSITAPIASATSLSQLNSFIEAGNLALDPSDISLLDKASIY